MIFRFLKKIFILSLLLSTAFSTFPSFLIEQSIRIAFNNNNVVDRVWLASSDSNVVDQFIPFQKVIDNLKVGTAFAVANGDGKIFYSISANTTPRTRDYVSSSNSFSGAVSTVAGGTALQSVIKASPTKDEMIAGYVNSSGTLQVMCWSGTAWTNEWSVALGGTGTTRRFDISYETNTGDAIVLYSTNTATTNELAYRTKAGASACGTANWSAATNLDPVRTSGIVQWVKLAYDKRSTSNLITAIWADANADLSAMVWTGSAWGNEPGSALATTLETASGATSNPDIESFDVEYESVSGDVMVVWGILAGANGTLGVNYATCTGGTSTCTWATVTTPPTWIDDATTLDISANPNSNEIVFASIGNAGADLQAGYWSGTAWTNTANLDTTATAPNAGMKLVSTGWLVSGATNRSVIVYYDSAATNIGWYIGNAGTFTVQPDFTVAPAFGNQMNYDIKLDPINKDRLVLSVNDGNFDIFAKQLIMTATPAFTWTNSDGSAAIEANTASNLYKTFDFEYNRYIPPSTTLATGSDPVASTIAPGAGATDVDLFTLQTSTSTEAITSVTVNLSTNSGIGTLAITDNANTVLGSTTTPVTGSNTITVTGMTANTTATTFKVRVTPLSHASMPAVPGASYAITAPVTGWAGSYAHIGSDTNTNALTIDNASPIGATSVSGTAGDTKNTINWTTSSSADFNTTSGSVVYRWTGVSAGAEVPAEGSTATIGALNGTATTACVVSSVASTPLSKIDGTGGSVECTTTALTNGQAYTYEVFQKDTNGNYDVGVLIGTFTPAVGVTVTSYTNTTETALNYAGACTGCGARIGGGAGFRQSITITGTGFGADPGVGNRSTASNNIKVGTKQIASANVTAWSATSITFLTDTNTAGDADADWGAEYGGPGVLTVTAGGGTSGGLNFFVFPQITSVTVPAGFGADTAREYSASDTDGVITLNGTRFGSPQGTGSVTILGSTATINSWATTSIDVQIPTAILDTTNTGNILMTQGTGTSGKTHTYANTLRILPRITGFTPTSGSEGSAVAVDGNHFCQTGTCPGAFSAGVNDVVFTSAVSATTFTSWTATTTTTAVPTGAVTGNVVLKSNSFASNALSFTVLSNTPASPTSLAQWGNIGLTQAIATGGVASTTPIYLSQLMEVPGITGGTLYPQFEVDPIGTAFTCGAGACAQATEGIGWAGPGPTTGTSSITVAGDVYHWQARTRHNKASVNYYSPWVSYGGNAENATDFQMDTTAPTITSVSSGTPGTNSATITWSTAGEIATTRVEYDTAGTFTGGYDCAGTAECTALTDTSPLVNAHSVSLSNLNSGTTYHYRVRSMDTARNEKIDPPTGDYTFTTSSTLSPSKTTRFHIMGNTTSFTGAATTTFSVTIPENATTTKSIFVEIRGLYVAGATPGMSVYVNSETARTYAMPPSQTSGIKILHPVTAVNLAPGTNTITITLNTGDTLHFASADIYLNYTYTP